jgi:5-methylcytosine-specific restriction endonuclease McrA
MKSKLCYTCKNELPVNMFSKDNTKKDGLYFQCKACNKEYYLRNKERKLLKQKQWYEENKVQVQQYYQENKETIREKNRQRYMENINKERLRSKIWRENNKEAVSEYRKHYYEKNKEYYIEYYKKLSEEAKAKRSVYGKEFKRDNKEKYVKYAQIRRAKKKLLPHTLTVNQWEKIKESFNYKCAYCDKGVELEQEHFIPLSKGGEYTHNNIIPSCKSCNSSKRDEDFFQWYPKQDFYSKEREEFILEYLKYTEDGKQQLSFVMGL